MQWTEQRAAAFGRGPCGGNILCFIPFELNLITFKLYSLPTNGPMVVTTFHERVIKPLKWLKYKVDMFMSIVGESNKDMLFANIHKAYPVMHLNILDLEPLALDCPGTELNMMDRKVLAQFYAIRHCYTMVEAAEKRRGANYTWLFRLRSDAVYFNDMVPHLTLSPNHAYLPRGGMTEWYESRCMNDHFFLCPRALCRC